MFSPELVKLHSEFVVMGVCACLSSACVMVTLRFFNLCSDSVVVFTSVVVCASLHSGCEVVSKSVDLCVTVHSGCVASVDLVVSSAF